MNRKIKKTTLMTVAVLILMFIIMLAGTNRAFAHCDTMDGPVVKAARKALETGDISYVLIWVQNESEPEIKKIFQKTLLVRKQGAEARELADMYFFETVVRIHRAGEGAPYTGLKPSGYDHGPVIPAADRAVEQGSAGQLLKLLTESIREGVHSHFQTVMERKNFNRDNIEAGRDFVEAYVSFVHYIEGIYEASENLVSIDTHFQR